MPTLPQLIAKPMSVENVRAATCALRREYVLDQEVAHAHHDALTDRYIAWSRRLAPSQLPTARAVAKLLHGLLKDVKDRKWYA